MSEQSEVRGYVSCSRCDEPWVLKLIASRTRGMCADCWLETRGTREVRSGPRVFTVSTAAKSKKKILTDRRRQMIKLRDKARLRALRRLADRHPVEFADLLAEERGHLGLEPWTIDAALQAQLQEAQAS